MILFVLKFGVKELPTATAAVVPLDEEEVGVVLFVVALDDVLKLTELQLFPLQFSTTEFKVNSKVAFEGTKV